MRVCPIIRSNVTIIFSFRVFAPLFACMTSMCLQLHVDTVLRDIKDFGSKLTIESVSSLVEGHSGTETVLS